MEKLVLSEISSLDAYLIRLCTFIGSSHLVLLYVKPKQIIVHRNGHHDIAKLKKKKVDYEIHFSSKLKGQNLLNFKHSV